MIVKVKKMIWAVVIIIGCVGLDQLTKFIARQYLQPKGTVEVIKNFFSFTFTTNTGGAWNFLGGKMWVFYIITLIALGIFGYLLKDFDMQVRKFYSIGIALMIAGTIGNFIDRVIFKYVTDFLSFTFFGWDFAIFNVADICLTFGVIFMAIQIVFFSSSSSGVANT